MIGCSSCGSLYFSSLATPMTTLFVSVSLSLSIRFSFSYSRRLVKQREVRKGAREVRGRKDTLSGVNRCVPLSFVGPVLLGPLTVFVYLSVRQQPPVHQLGCLSFERFVLANAWL